MRPSILLCLSWLLAGAISKCWTKSDMENPPTPPTDHHPSSAKQHPRSRVSWFPWFFTSRKPDPILYLRLAATRESDSAIQYSFHSIWTTVGHGTLVEWPKQLLKVLSLSHTRTMQGECSMMWSKLTMNMSVYLW